MEKFFFREIRRQIVKKYNFFINIFFGDAKFEINL